ncbi:MAG: tetratricopeptide repeat protein [Candidatus Palauibacterales bacterium]|nr:tetratricopeptide repeat protein [Candidatus Palauibacterales bacterium]
MVAPALTAALVLLLVLLLVRPPVWVIVLFLMALFLPGSWWHWKTRRFRRGLKLLRAGDPGEARSEIEAFLFQVSREPIFRRLQPYFNLGRSYPYEVAGRASLGVCDLLQGKPAAALERFREALAHEQGWVPAAYGEAVSLRLLGQPEAAEASARRALALRPSYLAARLLLGSLLRESGRVEEADEVLTPVADAGDDPDALLRALEGRWGIGDM